MNAAGSKAQGLVVPCDALPIRIRSPVDNSVDPGGDKRHRFHPSCWRVSKLQYRIPCRSAVRISLFPSGYFTLLVTVFATESISGTLARQLGDEVQQSKYLIRKTAVA